MSFLNKEELDNEFDGSRRWKFYDTLEKMWHTPDGVNWFFTYDGFGFGEDRRSVVAGVIELDVGHNQVLGKKWSLLNSIHIRSIGVTNDLRSCGFLGSICALLIRAAEESGVFIYGHAKPFHYNVPMLENAQQCLDWLKNIDCHDSRRRDKKTMDSALRLRERYLEMGFCRYDLAGLSLSDKFWRKTGFGFVGQPFDDLRVCDYFSSHLSC